VKRHCNVRPLLLPVCNPWCCCCGVLKLHWLLVEALHEGSAMTAFPSSSSSHAIAIAIAAAAAVDRTHKRPHAWRPELHPAILYAARHWRFCAAQLLLQLRC
jgi:hypothetical protein